MKISVLIPFHSDGGGIRDKIFNLVKKRYETLMPDVELVIGEDDGEPFNRARARNKAAAKATGDLFILADADIFFGAKLIDKIKTIVDFYPWIIPYSRGYKLNPVYTRFVISTGELQIPKTLRSGDVLENCTALGGFMNVMSRQAFQTVGGLDERFMGWGPEDLTFTMALDTLVGKHFQMNETIFHLWHPPAERYHQYTPYNEELKNRYCQADGNMDAMRQLIAQR
ncbi:MAG TPA: galactosyltransferase-related protein [Bacillota bacterium]|nr:galactosyltransferase-related protein [Bacillota bacterium]